MKIIGCLQKRQYAGIEIHKVIVQLFRYISKKYFSDFEMMDDGRYWETNDEKVLEESFDRFNFVMDAFAGVLEEFPVDDSDDPESMLKKLIEYIKKKMGDDGLDFNIKIISGDHPG